MAHYPIAIVGYGPTGETLANLLAARGLRVAVFEREADVYAQPRAIHMDGETMRVFQAVGIADRLLPTTRIYLGARYLNAAGRTLIRRPAGEALGHHGWQTSFMFHQPTLERMLREQAAGLGRVDVRLRHEVLAVEPEDDRVRLRVEDLAGGGVHEVTADWVVGCDGGRSLVRHAMGSGHVDLGLHQPWLVTDVLLRREVELPDHTLQICDPARPMTYVCAPGRRRRWEIMLMPGDDPVAMTAPARILELLARWVRPDDVEIERATVYTFHSLVARGWRRGRLLLAGDSAHQTPPFLGQGMCAGIRDAANLGWKLARVARGESPASLLDSYETERAPHVTAFIELAVRMGEIIQTTDPAVAAERDARFAGDTPQTLVYPMPPLVPSLHGHAPPPAGLPAPQRPVRIGDAIVRSDALLGDGFALVGAAAVTTPARDLLARAGIDATALDPAALADDGARAAFDAWLTDAGAPALLVRPDRYVLGSVRTPGDALRLVRDGSLTLASG
jgi:3-(3-hydroxy-phenyl)propionate hydroxylase